MKNSSTAHFILIAILTIFFSAIAIPAKAYSTPTGWTVWKNKDFGYQVASGILTKAPLADAIDWTDDGYVSTRFVVVNTLCAIHGTRIDDVKLLKSPTVKIQFVRKYFTNSPVTSRTVKVDGINVLQQEEVFTLSGSNYFNHAPTSNAQVRRIVTYVPVNIPRYQGYLAIWWLKSQGDCGDFLKILNSFHIYRKPVSIDETWRWHYDRLGFKVKIPNDWNQLGAANPDTNTVVLGTVFKTGYRITRSTLASIPGQTLIKSANGYNYFFYRDPFDNSIYKTNPQYKQFQETIEDSRLTLRSYTPVPPTITNIKVTPVTLGAAKGVLISWSTNLPADGIINDGLTNQYGFIQRETGLGTKHGVKFITSPGYTYHYAIRSCAVLDSFDGEASDQCATTADLTFIGP